MIVVKTFYIRHKHVTHQIPVQLLVTPHPGWFRSGEGWRPRPPGGRRRYKNPRDGPARDRHVAEQRQGSFRSAGAQGCVYGPRWLRVGESRSVKPAEFRVFPAALNVRFVQARRINTEL